MAFGARATGRRKGTKALQSSAPSVFRPAERTILLCPRRLPRSCRQAVICSRLGLFRLPREKPVQVADYWSHSIRPDYGMMRREGVREVSCGSYFRGLCAARLWPRRRDAGGLKLFSAPVRCMHFGMSSTASPPQSSQDHNTHRTHEQPSISSLKTFVGVQKIVPDTDGCEKGPGRLARSPGREPFNDTMSRTSSNIAACQQISEL